MCKLSQLKLRETGIVRHIEPHHPIRHTLMHMGIIFGSQILVWKKSPFGDPIEVKIGGFNLALRKEEADLITVQKL